MPAEKGFVARMYYGKVQEDLFQLRARPAAASPLRPGLEWTACTGESGLDISTWIIVRSRADVLTVAMRSSTSTRPQYRDSSSRISAGV